jgi:hypothetical protein
MNRLVIAIVMTGIFIGSALVGAGAKGGEYIWGVQILTWFGYMVAMGLGLVLVWSVVKSGRI